MGFKVADDKRLPCGRKKSMISMEEVSAALYNSLYFFNSSVMRNRSSRGEDPWQPTVP